MNSISKKRKLAILLASIVPVIVLLASLVCYQFVWRKKEGKQLLLHNEMIIQPLVIIVNDNTKKTTLV